MSDQPSGPSQGAANEISHRSVQTNGIQMHIAEQGEGPLLVLLHGFPELWYSWRHQIPVLAAAGYHVVAPDLRGYGQTDRPAAVEQYTQLHQVGDVIGLLDELGEEQAVVIGHDFGAPLAWNTALLRPDRVRGVVGMSVPHLPRAPFSALTALRGALGPQVLHQYLQERGVADVELDQDVRGSLLRFFNWGFGDSPQAEAPTPMVVPEGGTLHDLMPDPATLPGWLTEADLDYYTAEYTRTGFTGALNWWRTFDLSWELTAPWQGAPLTIPALFMYGDRDGSVLLPGFDQLIPNLQGFVPNLRGTVVLQGVGHWTQQEQPQAVNSELLKFLAEL
jgi:pimeloyl-ACP methyl ester carboxylesterase